MKKLPKPVVFDKLYSHAVVARDGEKFFVCAEKELSEIEDITENVLSNLPLKSLLLWAIENDYPLAKFVRLQKILVEKYFES